MHTSNVIALTAARRNAPNVGSRLSVLVDVAQAAVDAARAGALYPLADELDALRARAASIALGLWRDEGCGR